MTTIPANVMELEWDAARTTGSVGGEIEDFEGIGWVRLDVTAGTTYHLYAGTKGFLGSEPVFAIFDSAGALLMDGTSDYTATGTYTPTETGSVYVAIANFSGLAGPYDLYVSTLAGTDVLLDDSDDNYLSVGDERVFGSGGNDVITLGDSGIEAIGGTGNDTLTGNDLGNRLVGGQGDDFILAGAGNDVIWGNAGVDTIVDPDGGDDVIFGGDGADRILDMAGSNIIHGGNGADFITVYGPGSTLFGDAGNDALFGGEGRDKLVGGTGIDKLYGGDGNDLYYVDNVDDQVFEYDGEGTDTVYAVVSYALPDRIDDCGCPSGMVERLTLIGTGNISGTGNGLDNILTGNGGDNILDGADGLDVLNGGLGNDRLIGGAGNDRLNGGDGDDALIGGMGGERLSGGAGADTFLYTAVAESIVSSTNRDLILDFNAAEGDRIDLSAIDADTLTAGDQAFTFIGAASFTRHAGELRYAVVDGYLYLYGDVDGDVRADFSVRVDHVTSMQASDFIL